MGLKSIILGEPSQTEKGSSLNTYLILWDHAKASNYVIREQLGRLTVK